MLIRDGGPLLLVDAATVAGADMLIYSGCKGRRTTGGALAPPTAAAGAFSAQSFPRLVSVTGVGLIYVSGQLPVSPDGFHDLEASFEDQACISNLLGKWFSS